MNRMPPSGPTDETGARDSCRQVYLDRAEALVPMLRERAAETEAARRLLPDVEAAFHEAGLYRMMQPARIGGDEMDYGILIDVGAILARGCPSSAWHVANMASHHTILGYFEAEAQDEVWDASRDALICASLIYPSGRAEAVEGGYRLSGHWPFSSGIDNCQWHMVGGVVTGADGARENRIFLLPEDDYTILDTWHVTGLAGSGSHDVEAKDVFVPARRTLAADCTRGGGGPGSAVNPGPLFRLALQALFPYTLAGVALGTAEGMWDDFVETTRARTARYTGSAMADLQNLQIRIAEAGARLDAARLVMRANPAQAMALAEADTLPDPETKVRWRRDGAFAVGLCREAAGLLFQAAGGGGIQADHPLNRGFRDINAIAGHIAYSMDAAGTMYGRVALSIDAENPNL